MKSFGWTLLILTGACSAEIVPDPAPTVVVSVEPSAISLGESASVGWRTTGVRSCTGAATPAIQGAPFGPLTLLSNPTGSPITPLSTGEHVFTVQCVASSGGGMVTSRAVLMVGPSPTSDVGFFRANTTVVLVGEPVALRWEISDASNCLATGGWTGTRPAMGVESVALASIGPAEFALTCSRAGVTTTHRVVVTAVSPLIQLDSIYQPSSNTVSTSEGAPYGDSDFWITQDFSQSLYGYGPTRVVRIYICLSGKVSYADCSGLPAPTGPLSQSMLDGIEAGIAAYRGTGIRLLVRFVYNFGPIGSADVPADLISTHIDQLAPILLRHKDDIFALQAGFIGTWGEWHNSTSGNIDAATRRIVLDRERAHFHGAFPILVRYPADLMTYLGTSIPQAGFGLHDDFYASDDSDGGTFVPRDGYTAQQLRDYAAAVARTTMFVGEFGASNPALQSCEALSDYAQRYPLQSLSMYIYPEAIGDEIAARGCLLDFLNRVGPRIEVDRLRLSGWSVAGARIDAVVELRNVGYGRVIRARPVTVVVSAWGREYSRTTLDLGALDLRMLPTATPVGSEFRFSFVLPDSLPAGPVTVGLLVPDPVPSLRPRPEYALPFNSTDGGGRPMFAAGTGVNTLATFTIRALSAGALLASGTAVGGSGQLGFLPR